ncbi:hypothetical protein DFH06DRAFT_1462647 [Mycena polygramma]|nr:hypothetical protein DFH06DRAFT_1462647 [Mycena polygramma]
MLPALRTFPRLRPPAASAPIRRWVQSMDSDAKMGGETAEVVAALMQDRMHERDRFYEREEKLKVKFAKMKAKMEDKLAQSIERETELAAEIGRLKCDQMLEIHNLKSEQLFANLDRDESTQKIERAATLTKEAYVYKISNLLIDVQRARARLNLCTALEIVTEVLRLKAHPGYGTDPIIELAPGVQSVMDAIGKGTFDSLDIRGVTYADAQAKVLAAVAPGGEITPEDVVQALGNLYAELSERQWDSSVRKEIWISHSEHAVAEVVAAMSVLLFTRREFYCSLDAVYIDGAGKRTTVSDLIDIAV